MLDKRKEKKSIGGVSKTIEKEKKIDNKGANSNRKIL